MEFKKLGGENIDSYIAYLERAMEEEPDMMTAESVEEEGIRGRIKDPFYQNSVSLLAMEDGQVLGRIEYHFYGCLQDPAGAVPYRGCYQHLRRQRRPVCGPSGRTDSGVTGI